MRRLLEGRVFETRCSFREKHYFPSIGWVKFITKRRELGSYSEEVISIYSEVRYYSSLSYFEIRLALTKVSLLQLI